MIATLVCILIFAVLLFVDLATKGWAFAVTQPWDPYGNPNQTYDFIGLGLDRYKNTGIMLGIGDKSAEWLIYTLIVLTAFMIIAIAILFFTAFKRNTPARVALAVIEAGALGNFIDRIVLGYVRDFVAVRKFLFFPSYVCNVADMFILFGAIDLLLIILFIGRRAVFPLTKKWRAEAKILDAQHEKEKQERRARREERKNQK